MTKIFVKIVAVVSILMMHTNAMASDVVPLSFFTDTSDGVQWNWYSPDKKSVTTLYTFQKKPDAIHIDHNSKTIQVVADGNILQFNQNGERQNEVVKLPSFMPDEHPIVLWRDKADKQLRLATWLYIKPENIITQNTTTILKLPNGNTVKAMLEPEWGTHHVNRIFTLKDGAGRVLHTLASKGEAGDTPGLTVIKPYFHEAGSSDFKLIANKYCASLQEFYPGRICHSDPIDKILLDQLFTNIFTDCERSSDGYIKPRSCAIDTIGLINCPDCIYDLIHASVQGDRLHAMTPLYLLDKKTQKYVELTLPGISSGQQVWLDQSGHHILTETRGKVFVINMNTGSVISAASGDEAVWLKNLN